MRKYKVVVVGDVGVGKTSLLHRLRTGRFQEISESTIGCEFFAHTVGDEEGAEARACRLMIWDTAGQIEFRSFVPNFLRGANACVLCYDTSDPRSLQNVRTWHSVYVRPTCGDEAIVALVGTKADVRGGENATTAQAVSAVAADIGARMSLQTSAKTGQGVELLFSSLASALTERGGDAESQDGVCSMARLCSTAGPVDKALPWCC